jgi:hypothetical protein
MPQYQVKSQLYADAEARAGKGQILDDCCWSSCAAAVSWASGYTANYSAADGVAAFEKATGRKDVQGISDAGGSLPEAVKTIAVLGGQARYAKSWDDAMVAAKLGAALMVWVQQPIDYPAGVPVSKWHDIWRRYWLKTDKSKVDEGYGHMTSAGWCEDHGWQWACPTRDEKVAAEQYGVPVTEAQLRQIANSKVKAGKVDADYKCLLIVTHPGRVATPAPVSTPVAAPVVAPVAAPVVVTPAPEPKAAPRSPDAEPKALGASLDPAVQTELDHLAKEDWGAIGASTLHTIEDAVQAAGKEQTTMAKVLAFLKYVNESTGIVSALTEFLRTFVTVSISVALGLGIPLLDISGGDFRTVLSAGLASGLGVLVKWLDPKQSDFGIKESK